MARFLIKYTGKVMVVGAHKCNLYRAGPEAEEGPYVKSSYKIYS